MQITAVPGQAISTQRPLPRPAGGSEASGPRDVFATSGVGTAEEALRLPILDPVFQLGMAMGTLSAMMGGAGGATPQVALRLVSRLAEGGLEAEYRLDMEDPSTPVTGSGTVNGQPLQETARLEQGQLLWHGSVGSEQVDLHIGLDETKESMTMKGSCGPIQADLTVGLLSTEENPFEGIRTTGRLDGQAYSVDTLIQAPEGGLRAGGDPGHLLVRGHLNGQLIHRDYSVTVEKAPNGFALKAHGGGIVAGQPENLEIQVRVSDRG